MLVKKMTAVSEYYKFRIGFCRNPRNKLLHIFQSSELVTIAVDK